MPNDVKSLLDSIIDDTDNSYPKGKGGHTSIGPVGSHSHPQTFDSGKFREKLSLYVLHDLVVAMMHDETKDLDDMIDHSIMRHINQEYNGSCYGYLCGARDRLKSPLFSDIIQEIDDKTDKVKDEIKETKDDEEALNGEINIQDILKNVTDYEEFRDKLKEVVSNKVVDDVAGVITKRNDAPTFDDLDEVMVKKDADKVKEEDTTQESVILRLCGAIVTESAINNEPISTEQGLNMAIVEYCLNQMDFLCKAIPKKSMYDRYRI